MPGEIRIGGVRIDWRGDTSQLERAANRADRSLRKNRNELRKTRRSFGSSAQAINKFSQSLGALRSVVAGALVFGGIARLIKSQSDYGALLIENSVRTGIAVKDLQTLQRTFEGDGVAAEKFNKSIVKLSKNLAIGTDTLRNVGGQDAFALLGIDAEEEIKRGTTILQLLYKTADGFRRLENQQIRVAVAQQLFGRSGADMLNVLQQGSEGVQRLQRHFAQFGIVTREEAQDLKDLNQAITDVGNTLQTALAQAVAQESDTIQDLLDTIARDGPGAIRIFLNGLAAITANLKEIAIIFGTIIGYRVFRALGSAAISFGRVLLRLKGIGLLLLPGIIKGVGRISEEIDKLNIVFLRNEKSWSRTFREIGIRVAAAFLDAFINTTIKTLEGFLISIGALFRFHGNIFTKDLFNAAFSGDFIDTYVENVSRSFERLGKSLSEVISGSIQPSFQIPIEETILNAFDLPEIKLPRVRQIIDIVSPKQVEPPTLSVPTTPKAETDTKSLNFIRDIQIENERLIEQAKRRLKLVGETKIELAVSNAVERVRLQLLKRETSLQRQLESAVKSGNETRIQSARFAIENFQTLLLQENELFSLVRTRVELEGKVTKAFEKSREQQERLKSILGDLRSGFSDFTTTLLTDFDKLNEAVRRLGENIRESIIRQLVSEPLSKIGSDLIKAAIPVALSFFAPAAPVPAAAGVPLGLGIGRFHEGGLASGLSIVGERGPELADFRTPARIYPNKDFQSLGGGDVQINQTFNIESTDGPGVQRALLEATPAIVEASLTRVTREFDHPSSLRSAARNK